MDIINRYILKQIIIILPITIMFFIFIMISGKVFQFLDKIENLRLLHIGELIIYILPNILNYIIPISFIITISIVFSKMNLENELFALKACGLNLRNISTSIISMGAILSILCIYLNFYSIPKRNIDLKKLTNKLKTQATILKSQHYQKVNKDTYLYYHRKHKNKLINLDLIKLNKNKIEYRIFAKEGNISTNENNISLFLNDTLLVQHNKNKTSRILAKNLKIELEGNIQKHHSSSLRNQKVKLLISQIKYHQLKYKENKKAYHKKRYIDCLFEFNRRLVISISPLIFCLIIIPLSMFNKTNKKSSLIECVIIIICYHVILTIIKSLRTEGLPYPHLMIFLPNILGLIFFFIFLKRLYKA